MEILNRLLACFILLLAWNNHSICKDYSVDLISDSLLKNSSAVLRDELFEYVYYSPEKNVSRHKRAITILNKNGDSHAVLLLNYDQFTRIESIRGTIFNKNGIPIKAIKYQDIGDFSGSAAYVLFDDVRYKYYQPLISEYPYTVEFEYEVSHKDSYSFPDFLSFEDYNVSIEKSVLRVQVPHGYKLNRMQFNKIGDPIISENDNMTTYEWSISNVTAINAEPFEDALIKSVSAVYTSPSEFSLSGYKGKMDTWNDYALWIASLNHGKDTLPNNRVYEIRELVKDAKDQTEKIRILYNYLQKNTRYFNIALGLGGLQPTDATTVDRVGYGDCKGLSIYMMAMLKAIGIKSYYTLVKSGKNLPEIITGFPQHQFDHAMLCVPLQEDTIWLECTSQILPFGFLGDFTCDRNVLLIKENGGEWHHTPAYSMKQNIQNTSCTVELKPDGSGKAFIKRTFGGLQFDDYIFILHSNTEDQRQWLLDYIDIPNFQLNNFGFHTIDSEKPISVLTFSVDLRGYASATGKRLFLPLNLTNRNTFVPTEIKERRTDIRRIYSYLDSDTIEYLLPEGMSIEYLPEPVSIRTPFGEYDSKVVVSRDGLIYYRHLKVFKGVFDKTLYPGFVEFYYDISVADKEQVILLKQN